MVFRKSNKREREGRRGSSTKGTDRKTEDYLLQKNKREEVGGPGCPGFY